MSGDQSQSKSTAGSTSENPTNEPSKGHIQFLIKPLDA
jgi:hypothetical protein